MMSHILAAEMSLIQQALCIYDALSCVEIDHAAERSTGKGRLRPFRQQDGHMAICIMLLDDR